MEKTRLSIRDYIVQNPSCTVKQVIKATGAQPSSVHTSFTAARIAYNKAVANAAGIVHPEGYPPLRVEDVEALNKRRFTNPTVSKKLKEARLKNLQKARAAKKVIDLTAQPLPLNYTPKQTLLTDEEIQTMFAYVSGKVDGLRESGNKADLAIMLVRNVEKFYGLK